MNVPEYGTKVEYTCMYLVTGFCKLGTTFCANFEQQRYKISVYRAENAFHFEFEEKKSADFAWACLVDPRFTDHLLFKTGFCWTYTCVHKYTCIHACIHACKFMCILCTIFHLFILLLQDIKQVLLTVEVERHWKGDFETVDTVYISIAMNSSSESEEYYGMYGIVSITLGYMFIIVAMQGNSSIVDQGQ